MPSNTYISLATVTLASTDSEVVFASIPATYRDLVMVFNGTTNAPGADSMTLRFNTDTGSNYSNVRMVGNSSGASSYSDTTSGLYIGVVTSSSEIMTTIAQVMDYAATDKHKSVLARHNQAGGWVTAHAGRWANTAAITTLRILPPAGSTWTFQIGSTFSLFGIAS